MLSTHGVLENVIQSRRQIKAKMGQAPIPASGDSGLGPAQQQQEQPVGPPHPRLC